MPALEGLRVLVLSGDPSAVEPLVVRLEDAGADVQLRFSLDGPPEDDALDAAVVHPSIFETNAAVADSYLEALSVPVVEATDDALDRLVAVRSVAVRSKAVPEPAEGEELERLEPEPVRPPSRRLLRVALTVLAVTIVLSVVVGRFAQRDVPAVGTVAPGADAVAAGQLAGRVVRSDTNAGISGATVVASGPSGPIATITDDQGRWRFTGLRAGRYVVMSTTQNFVAKQVQVDVPENQAVENVNLSLDPG